MSTISKAQGDTDALVSFLKSMSPTRCELVGPLSFSIIVTLSSFNVHSPPSCIELFRLGVTYRVEYWNEFSRRDPGQRSRKWSAWFCHQVRWSATQVLLIPHPVCETTKSGQTSKSSMACSRLYVATRHDLKNFCYRYIFSGTFYYG